MGSIYVSGLSGGGSAMSELETLKDLRRCRYCDSPELCVSYPALKESVINDIKELTKKGILGDLNSQDRHIANMARKA